MACDSTLPSKADLQKLKRQAEFIAQVGTGRDANNLDVSQVTNPDTGETVITVRGWADQFDALYDSNESRFDTLFADTQNEANDAIDTYRRINAGDYSSGPLLLDDKFTYATYNGDRFYAVSPPYTTDPVTFPDPNTDTNLILLDLPDEQFVRTVANQTAEQILDGEIFPGEYDQALPLGAQSTVVPAGVTKLRVNTGSKIEILYLWEPSGDFSASSRTVTDISANAYAGYDVTASGVGVPFEFLPSVRHAARKANDPFGYGAVGDGIADDTAALVRLHAEHAVVDYPGDTVYLYDPEAAGLTKGIVCKEGQIINCNKSEIKLKGRAYSDNIYVYGTSYAINFSDDANRYKGLIINDMVFDGNSENVTLAANKSSNAAWLYKQDSPRLNRPKTKNMPIGNGGLPAIILRFCEDVTILDPVTEKYGTALYATDRQSILVVESTGRLINGDLSNSKEREPVVIASETPVAWKKSNFHVIGGRYDNRGTLIGSRVIRFSGASDGSIDGGAKLISDKQNGILADINAIFIAYPVSDGMPINEREHDIYIGDVIVEGAANDIRIQNPGLTKVTIDGLRSKNVWRSLESTDSYSNGVDTGYLKVLSYNCECTQSSFNINFCENVFVNQMRTVGGSINASITNYGLLFLNGVAVDNNSAPSYILSVGDQLDAYAVTFKNQPVISNCGGFGSANNVMRFAGVSTLAGDAIAWIDSGNTFGGYVTGGGVGDESIPCTRNGPRWLWHDDSGNLRTKFGAPKTLVEGVIVGTQV